MDLALLALAYVFSQFYRSFLPVLTPQLTSEIGVDSADLSLATGIWFVAFALMQFVVGVALDRYGPRFTAGILFGVAGSLGAGVFAFASAPWHLVLALALMGVGCAPVLMATFHLFTHRFSAARFALFASWFVAFGNLGNIVGTSPLAAAVDAWGWRSVMLALGAINVVIALGLLLVLRDPPRSTAPASTGLAGYVELLKIRKLWCIFPLMLVSYATVAGIRGLWTGPLLADLHGADSLLIGRVTLWMALAMATGSLIYGTLDQIFNTRKWAMLSGSAILLTALVTLALNPDMPLGRITLLLVIIGIGGNSYGLLMAHGRSFVPRELTGRGITLLNFFSIFGVGLLQWLSGALVRAQPDPTSVGTYQLLFMSYAVVVLVAVLVYLTATDVPPRPRQ
ncbi:MAG: MFS transporter [Gammaproteobacteria bacterium]|nr:MAG: MFS transporter [Gammaproteobacteria bacterium]